MSESGLPLPTPELDHGAVLRHQVLVDPTGRRRRRLAIAGRVATTALGLWLAVLILGGLGLQPLAGIPIVGDLGARGAAPPALPERVQAAAAKRATGVPAPPAARASLPTGPLSTGRVPSRHAGTAPSPAKPRPQVQKAPATTPGPAAIAPGVGPTSSAPAPSRLPKSPTTTAPGQTRTPPGHTKTAPGPPTTTPGTTPRGNDNAPAAKGR